MSEDIEKHAEHPDETQRSRTEAESESEHASVSRRSVLEGTGKLGAVGAIPFNQLTGIQTSNRSPGKGGRVIVVQGTPQDPISFEEKQKARAISREDHIDKGNDPLEQYPYSDHGSDEPLVAFVKTIGPNGTMRGFDGIVSTEDIQDLSGEPITQTTRNLQGRAVAYGREYAKRNDTSVEIHRPNGKVTTHRPKAITEASSRSNANPASPLSEGTSTAYIGEQDLSITADSAVDTEGMNQVGVEEPRNMSHPDYGMWESQTDWYIADDYFYDSDGVRKRHQALKERFSMNPGSDDTYRNEAGIVHHDWGLYQHGYEGMNESDEVNVEEWRPLTDKSGSQSYSVGLSFDSSGASGSLGYTYTQDDVEVVDDTDFSNDQEEARWVMNVDSRWWESTRTGTIVYQPASMAVQSEHCSEQTLQFRAWYHGVFKKWGGTEGSITENWYHWFDPYC